MAADGNSRSLMEADVKFTSLRLLSIVFLLMLAACTNGGIQPASQTSAGKPTGTPDLRTPSKEIETPSRTATLTSTISPINTATHAPYQLLDWREPVEIITPVNIDRVEQIGQLRFMNEVATLAWSPEGSILAVGSDSGLFIMDSFSFTLKNQFDSIYTYRIAFNSDGKILQIGLPYINITTGEIINKELMEVPYPGTDIEFSPDGKYRINMGADYGVISYFSEDLYDIAFGRQYADAMHVSISRDSKIFAVNYRFLNYTELWDPYTVRPIRKLELKGITAQGKPRFSNNGSSIYFTGQGTWENLEASFIQEWDYTEGKPLDVQILPETIMYYDLAMDLSPLSDVIIFGGSKGGMYIIKHHDCHAIKIGQSSNLSGISHMIFRPDGKMFATIEDENQGTIDLWGIPGTGGENYENTPTVTVTESPCPKIPVIRESLTPEEGWQSAK